jgi:hypothetical protein
VRSVLITHSYCVCVQVGAFKDWSGGASLMGMTTFGEIGHLPNSNDFPHYDSLMFGAIIFSKRKRKEYLYF